MGALDEFRTSNWVKRLNRAAQILLALALMAGINHLATQHYWRKDLTRQGLYSLSPETIAYLRALDAPVHVVVTIPEEAEDQEKELLYRYVKNLLEEYRSASRFSGQERITLEFVDPFRHLRRAEELARDYNIDQPYVVIFASGARQRVVVPTEILDFQNLRPSAFKGEQAFTSAILEVAGSSSPAIYFVAGHGEMDLESVSPGRGLSAIAQELRFRNLQLRILDLTQGPVPEDASLVVLADPQGPLLPEEVERLRAYLGERSGRAIFMLGAGRETGLDGLMARWGIKVDDMVVLEQGADYIESSGGLLIRQFAEHPVTDPLLRNKAPVVAGLTRPVRADANAMGPVQVTLLLASSSSSWAERAWRQGGIPAFDPASDIQGPVPLGAIAEMGGASQLGITVPGGRLAVLGIGDLVANRRVTAFGNHTLFMSLVNWMLDREQVIAMEPRPIPRYNLPLSHQDLREVFLILLVPAGALGLVGLVIAFARRF